MFDSAIPTASSASDRTLRIILYVQIPLYRDALVERLGDVQGIDLVRTEDEAELSNALAGADALIVNGSAYTQNVSELVALHAGSLRWLHSTSGGNEKLMAHGTPDHVIVTRSGGHSAPIVAEHAVALLLALARGLPAAMENQRKRLWIRNRNGGRAGTTRSLFGRTAVVIGFGAIGQAIAQRLRVLGMRVIAVTRSGTPHDLADQVFAVSDLKLALTKASVLVGAAPATPETEGLIGRDELATLESDSFVVNVGRGSLIDTPAIEAALREGTILGAGLDVQDPEPLPPEHSLWDAPNLIITPHRAGGGDPASAYRQADSVLANIDRFRRGEPLLHRFDTRQGAG